MKYKDNYLPMSSTLSLRVMLSATRDKVVNTRGNVLLLLLSTDTKYNKMDHLK